MPRKDVEPFMASQEQLYLLARQYLIMLDPSRLHPLKRATREWAWYSLKEVLRELERRGLQGKLC